MSSNLMFFAVARNIPPQKIESSSVSLVVCNSRKRDVKRVKRCRRRRLGQMGGQMIYICFEKAADEYANKLLLCQTHWQFFNVLKATKSGTFAFFHAQCTKKKMPTCSNERTAPL
jgi:hypothetical protein